MPVFLKEAPKENELKRIGALGERTWLKKSKWSNWRLKKYRKSTKAATKLAVRSENRKRLAILFRIAAKMEHLGASVAVMEQFEGGERREVSVKEAQSELLSVKGIALHMPLGCHVVRTARLCSMVGKL